VPIRIRYKIEAIVSSTTAEDKDLGNQKYEVVTDDLGEGGARKTFLPSAASDVSLDLGNVADAKLIILRTNARDPTEAPSEIRIKINGTGNEERPIVPLSGTSEGHYVTSTTGVTAIFASNPGTVDMEITLVVAGD